MDDSRKFDALLRPHLDRLYRLAFRLCGNRPDAEDLVQDVLVKAYRRRAELARIDELSPWLGRVLYHRFVDQHRSRTRRRLHVVAGADQRGGLPDPVEIAADPSPGPEQAASRRDNIRRLEAAIARLSEEHRTVLLMHDTEGYKLEEIQKITGTPVGTVKSRLHRARARLRELLAEDGTF